MSSSSRSSSVWKLDAHNGRLQQGPLHARLALDRPDLGLTDIRYANYRLAGCRLLGVEIVQPQTAAPPACIDQYVRSGDLVATYEETGSPPVGLQVYWRCEPTDEQFPEATIVDLQVSVQTEVLQSKPVLRTTSRFAPAEVCHLRDVATAHFEPVALANGAPWLLSPSQGPGCVLLRVAGAPWSYAEMVHPDDRCGDGLMVALEGDTADSAGQPIALHHRLFSEELEKGVILRARVRGIFLPRRTDMTLAAAAYAALASSELPLTT